MRHPNGYGSVVKLSGNRRRPYFARKTKEIDERGYPVYCPIGYYATREEGLIALAEYNRDPYDVDLAKITMKELYDRWSKREFPKMPKTTARSHMSAMNHCSSLHDSVYRSIKSYQMQHVIDHCGLSYSTQGSIKTLFRNLDLYALELEIISRMNSELLRTAPTPPTSKKPFEKSEIEILWDHQSEPFVDTALILIYSGFRINELLNMPIENVNLNERWFKGGLKTKAGIDRLVPIHSLLFDMVEKRAKEGNEYLICRDGKRLTYSKYRTIWWQIMNRCGLKHTPHECRHTFRTLLDSAGANKKCIDMMMGHKSRDVGERIYTHKTIEELREALELVTR